MQGKKNLKAQQRESSFRQIEKMHPYKMFMVLAIMGISMLFLFLVIAYSLSISNSLLIDQVSFPKMFTLGTFILVASSFSLSAAVKAFENDNMRRLHYMLFITLLMGVVFAGCQVLGWLELNESGVFLSGKSSGAFLYVISGLHIAHLSGGLILLAMTFWKSYRVKRDPIKALVMVTNPFEKLKLDLLATYWHYLGVLWVALFFFFLFTY
ncbi:MAG: cytochrome c oxidase subunit 3 [Cyclobacteriaceae bacterium]|nr:cytochrome c oxidase subunit 3 [Cyclobacteriaceae bacterium]